MPRADDFDSATENSELVELLRRRIEADGAITFHDYMDTVLYYPELGYYATRLATGRAGDYLTSPEVSPVFGAMVAKQVSQLREVMDRPERFDVFEQGAGTGRLARDILRWASTREPGLFRAMRYRIVEISPSLRRRQQEALATLPLAAGQVEWLDELPDGIEGCVVSNELLDSFPVHRVLISDGQLQEIYVSFRSGRFEEQIGPLSRERIAQYFADLGLDPAPGCTVEVNLRALDWMRDVSQKLRRGFVLTFDYGYEAPELYAPWRRDGTLLCFHRHNASTDPYARIGRQDMTAHVDFTSLVREGAANGLDIAGFTTQARFLANLGIGAGVDAVAGETPEALEEYYARRRAVQELIDPAGLGRVRVLTQRKGIGPIELWAFREERGA